MCCCSCAQLAIGAVLHPLNIRLGPTELEYIIGDANDSVCICDQDLLHRLALISAEGLKVLRQGIIVCGPVAGEAS